MEMVKRQWFLGVRREEGISRKSIEGFQGRETLLYNAIIMGSCHYAFFKTHRHTMSRVNHKVNCKLWVIMMCHSKFTDCNKPTILMWDIDSGGGWAYVETEVWENSVLYAQVCCELKNSLFFYFLLFAVLGLHCGTWSFSNCCTRIYWPVARGILVPWPGIKPTSPALEGRFWNSGPSEKSLKNSLKNNINLSGKTLLIKLCSWELYLQ